MRLPTDPASVEALTESYVRAHRALGVPTDPVSVERMTGSHVGAEAFSRRATDAESVEAEASLPCGVASSRVSTDTG